MPELKSLFHQVLVIENFEKLDRLLTINFFKGVIIDILVGSLIKGGCQLCKYQIEISYQAYFLKELSLHCSQHQRDES